MDLLTTQVFQYPFDKQECAGTILLPWKNNYTVALTTGSDPIKILGEVVMVVMVVVVMVVVAKVQQCCKLGFLQPP